MDVTQSDYSLNNGLGSRNKEDQKSPKTEDPHFPCGAIQGHPPSIGVGVVLFLNQNHYINIRYAPGGGSNNKAKLIVLWTLLETTKQEGCQEASGFG
jgi:hypothetical protein